MSTPKPAMIPTAHLKIVTIAVTDCDNFDVDDWNSDQDFSTYEIESDFTKASLDTIKRTMDAAQQGFGHNGYNLIVKTSDGQWHHFSENRIVYLDHVAHLVSQRSPVVAIGSYNGEDGSKDMSDVESISCIDLSIRGIGDTLDICESAVINLMPWDPSIYCWAYSDGEKLVWSKIDLDLAT